MLVRQLPPESATYAALRGGPQFRGWGQDRYMLADLIDSVNNNTHVFISANAKKKPKPPKPFPRPEKKKKNPANSFRAIAAARMKAVRDKRKGLSDGEGAGR